MSDKNMILCGSNQYEQLFYLNPAFLGLPDTVKKELNILCVLFTEEVGGLVRLEFDEEGSLLVTTAAREDDFFYDEITSGLKVREMKEKYRELFESLENYYRIFILNQG